MLSADQQATIIALAIEARTTPSDAKGWIPTHDGLRTKSGAIRDPYIRNSDSSGPIKAYLPWFSSKGAANSWCKGVGAVATACSYGEASDIARAHGAKLVEA